MTTCAVSSCKNNRRKTDKGPLKIVYHRFPKDNAARQKWIKLCKRDDKINIVNAKICSVHFKETDYKRDLRNELLGLEVKKELNGDAVPSLNLPDKDDVNSWSHLLELTNVMKPSTDTTTTYNRSVVKGRKDRYDSREVRKRALHRLATLSPKKDTPEATKVCPSFDNCDTMNDNGSVTTVCQTDKTMSDKINSLTLRIEEHQAQVRALITEKREVTERLGKCIQSLKARVKVTETRFKSEVNSKVREMLLRVFTRKQIKCLVDGKSTAKWQEEDIRRAMALRTISKKAYVYMRKTIGFPLPGLATLRRWSELSKGKQSVVYKTLDPSVPLTESAAESSNTCIFAFDVLNVDVSDEDKEL